MKARILSISIPAICMIGTVLLLIGACQKPRTPIEPDPDPQPTWVADTTLIPQIIAQIDSNRIRNTIQTLQDFGTRYAYSPKCFEAAEWIKGELESYGYTVEYQTFFNHRFYDIEFTNDNQGWMVGKAGVVLRTVDGGLTWERLDLGLLGKLDGVHFIDDKYGWVWEKTSPLNAYRTTDGGNTWQDMQTIAPDLSGVEVIYFLTREKGWIGIGNSVYFTKNGGNSWDRIPQNFGHSAHGINEVYFSDDLNGWIGSYSFDGFPSTYRTTDGGLTWTSQDFEGDVLKIRFSDRDFGVMLIKGQNSSRLWVTDDGGDNWQFPSDFSYIYDFEIIDRQTIVAVGGGCHVSEDGGQTWQHFEIGEGLTDICFRNEHDGFLTGNSDIRFARTFDGGYTWTVDTNGLPDEVFFHNIKVQKQGKLHPEHKYIIGAHYDSINSDSAMPAPGANDNASGTACVLETARIMKDYNFDYTIEFILFAAEEIGLQGSRHATRIAGILHESILGMVNLDMIGYAPDNVYDIQIYSHNIDFRTQFIATALNYHSMIYYEDDDHLSDCRSYYEKGYPALGISEYTGGYVQSYPGLHHEWDTIDLLNIEFTSNVIQFCTGGLVGKLVPMIVDQ